MSQFRRIHSLSNFSQPAGCGARTWALAIALLVGFNSAATAQQPRVPTPPPTGPFTPPTFPGAPPVNPNGPPGNPGVPPGTPGVPPTGPYPAPPFPPFGPFPPPVVIVRESSSGPASRIETLDQAIEALKSGDTSYSKAFPPLVKLKQWPVDAKRRGEVAGLLNPLLTTDQLSVRRAAQDAVKAWGTPQNVPTLLKLLEWQDWGDRTAAIEGLATIGGKEAAQAVTAKLSDKDLRSKAKTALEEMGPVAEEFVYPHIGAGDDTLHSYACQIIGKIGTAKSLAKLKARRPERESGRKVAVNSAIRDMETRLRKR